MKKLISYSLLIMMSANIALADCDYSKVVKNGDGTFTYTKELHICVGQMKQDLEIATSQIVDYKKAIELKDLAIKLSGDRSDLWMNTSFKLQDRMNTIEDLKSKNNWLYYGLGIASGFVAVWAAGQLRK